MKILFAYTGNVRSSYGVRNTHVIEDLLKLPTTHASEVNYLLLCHWLRELGHEIHFITDYIKGSSQREYDALFIFKIHGLYTTMRYHLLNRDWSKVCAWLDAPAPENVLGSLVSKLTHCAWGTRLIERREAPQLPWAKHATVEHATTFVAPPKLGPAIPRGLYIGRMPICYRDQVLLAANYAPMITYALWLETQPGCKILLRPGQYQENDLQAARATMPHSVDFHPGINVLAQAEAISQAAFGLCPATFGGPPMQMLSASKFYDYLALGLPVVLADNLPEEAHVRCYPNLGRLYQQRPVATAATTDLGGAINLMLERSQRPSFIEERRALQDWVFNHATYKHRAETLHAFFTSD